MNKITVTYSRLCEFVSFLRYEVDTEPGDLNILALQGVNPVDATPTKTSVSNTLETNNNEPDKQNDTIVMFGRSEEGNEPYVQCMLGTTDPGRYYTVNSPNPLGAAHLTFGQHLYTKGLHSKKHPALRSLDEVNRVWRDKNGNFELDLDELVYEGFYGTNVHAGSSNYYVGRNSAGCINIAGGYSGSPYKTFLDRVEEHSADKKAIKVNIWRGRDLFEFFKKGWDHKPTLVPGMKGGWVVEAQRLLNDALGLSFADQLTVDGDWRSKTTQAVLAFQKKMSLKQDGWIGPTTWFQLEFVAGTKR